jgi:hypothetical protein
MCNGCFKNIYSSYTLLNGRLQSDRKVNASPPCTELNGYHILVTGMNQVFMMEPDPTHREIGFDL